MADMGLGKTVMSLTAFSALRKKKKIRGLIIAPPSVARNVWQDEVAEWKHLSDLSIKAIAGTPEQRLDILLNDKSDLHVLPSSVLVWFANTVDHHIKSGDFTWPYAWMFLDESSMYRNIDSKRSRIAYRASKSTPYITLLTATPTPKDYVNLYQQLKLVDEGYRLGRTAGQYEQRFFNVKNRGYFKQVWLKPKSKKKIHKLIKDVCHRFDAKDYLKDIPELQINNIKVRLPKSAKDLYKELEKEKLVEYKGHTITAVNDGALAGKKHQIANGTVLDDEGEPVIIHNEKIDRLKVLLEDIGDKNCLIAYSHTADRIRILDGIKGQWFKGSLKDQRKWNNNRDSGLRYVCHPASMGHGLNLQKGGSIVIWYGLPRDLELYEQLRGRVQRQGQKETCIIHNLIADVPVDSAIYSTLLHRNREQEELKSAMK